MIPKNILTYTIHVFFVALGVAYLMDLVPSEFSSEDTAILMDGMHSSEQGKMYHEIIVIQRTWFKDNLLILNDIDNVLSEKEFSELDKNSLSADIVRISGPKISLFDQISQSKQIEKIKVLGHEWCLLASSDPSLVADMNIKSYEKLPIRRYSSYLYRKGSQVYELISDKGEIYTMLDFSRARNHDLTLESLVDLGSHLSLPEGWSFRTRVLHEDLILNSEKNSYVTQDEYQNTYQKTSSSKNFVAH